MGAYLVTGAAGFIGSRVSDLLLDAGHTVIGWDNLNNAYDVRVKDWRLKRLEACPKFMFQKLDISDRQAVENARLELDGQPLTVDGIINLAARAVVRQSVENPWVYVDTNMTGTLNLLEMCRRLNIPKFILASTSSIYGENAPLPTPETANSDHPLQPYSASKKGAEAMAHAYHFLNGTDVTIFRYFTVYGPAGRPDMSMFRFVKWINEGRPLRMYGSGEQTRGFTYVDDIARGTILGLKPVGFEVMNLGGHEVISMNQLIQIIEELLGRKAEVKYLPANQADMLANQADISKAQRMLGWDPQVGLREGIQRLVDWYLSEREWAKDIDTD
jgi:UDP-glucuronate 4-epimerase